MKLLTLQMGNFRQFFGETPKVRLAEGDKNITIFHGANGSGKTTLLNALTWLLYGQFTDAFAPGLLVNKKALRAARPRDRVECWVELMFEHQGRKYILKRTKTVIKVDGVAGFEEGGPSKVSLDSAREDGHWRRVSDDEVPDVIGRILPNKLLPYFFFDGERIESLQRSSRRPDVISATTMLVGEEVIVRAINHLEEARKRIEGELKQIGDSETTHLVDTKSEVDEQLQELRSRQERWAANLDGYRKQQKGIQESLREIKSVQEIQKRRDLLVQQAEQLEQTVTSSQATLSNLVSTQGYRTYLRSAVEAFRDIVSGLRDQGELPASIKATFVADMLRRQECICGRGLHPGEQPYEEVEKWLARGGMSDVEEVALRMEAEINSLDREIPQFFERLDKEQETRTRAKEQQSRVEGELSQIREELKGSSEENARDLETRLAQVEDAIERTRRHQVEDEQEIKLLESRLENLSDEIERRKGITDAQQLVNRRLIACREATTALKEVQTRLRTNFRLDLTDRINHLFSKMSFKPYMATLDPNYALMLVDANDSPVGPSTGESALLSLSFIGAVIDQARELTSRRDRLPGPDSSVFPVVMDSPFGNLDPIYRRQVAKYLPELAYQVVIMASKTQFQGEVENTMYGRIGKEYVLRYHSPKPDAHEDRIERYGTAYDLIVRNSPDEDEWTEIVEVTPRG